MSERNIQPFTNIVFVVIAAIAFLLTTQVRETVEPKEVFDLAQIMERGTIVATTKHSPSCYFIYRAEPMGFQLEMLSEFCKHLGVLLDIRPAKNLGEKFECLLVQNRCDLIALPLNPTYERKELFNLAEPYASSRHVLVQREKPKSLGKFDGMVRSLERLHGRSVFVQEGSSYVQSLRGIEKELCISIDIVELGYDEEEIVKMVADGEIDFTVCDELVATPNSRFFPVLDIQTPVTREIDTSWAVRKNAPVLLDTLNKWIVEFRDSKEFAALFRKYFDFPRRAFRLGGVYHSLDGSKISPYDAYFKRHAPLVGWDWRLIASLAYQESRFIHDTTSWAGAMGIMQIMPTTAESLYLDSLSNLEDHIRAGIRYLKRLDRKFEPLVEDSLERISFVIGSYNSGPGHVLDARRLAEKYGRNPNIWIGNVDFFVLNKSKYLNDEVVKHGFLRGWETYRHVQEVWRRYEHYRNIVTE